MSKMQHPNSLRPYAPEQAPWSTLHPAPIATPTSEGGPALFHILFERRKALFLSMLAALVVAFLFTMAFRTQSWEHGMIINYTPAMDRDSGYQSPSVNTLASFLKAPQIAQTMRSEFPDYGFNYDFDDVFEVVVPYDTQTVEISLKTSDDSNARAFRDWIGHFFHLKTWSTPPKFIDDWNRRFSLAQDDIESSMRRSERVLNRLQVVFAEYVAGERRTSLHGHAENLRLSLEQWKGKLRLRKAELAAFNSKHRVQDLKLETNALLATVAGWEKRLEDARLAKTATDEELEEILRRLNALKNVTNSAQKTSEELKKLGQSPQRLIQRTQRRMNVEKLRSLVEQEGVAFEYDTKLHDKQYLSDKIYHQRKLKLAALEKELEGAERIWELELQIEAENVVVGTGSATGGTNAHSRKFDLELEHITGVKSIDHLEKKLVEKRDQLARLQALREQAATLNSQVDIAGKEVIRILGQVLYLERLEGYGVREFTVTRPATLEAYSIRTNTKKWFLATFVLCCLLFGTPFIARDLLPRHAKGAEAQAEQLGIPVLVHASIVPESGDSTAIDVAGQDEHSRLLALRIQQAIPRSEEGAVVLFSGLDQSADVSTLSRLAKCWARRGERVMLLDTGDDQEVQDGLMRLLAADQVTLEHRTTDEENTEDTSPAIESRNGQSTTLPATNGNRNLPQVSCTGLSDLLAGNSVDWSDLIQKTDVENVDCVMAGKLPMPAEGLATHRMTEFLDELRQRYSLIVLMGPSTARPVDLELLASRADGIVFSTDGQHDVSERASAVVKNLVELNAPVLGIIS